MQIMTKNYKHSEENNSPKILTGSITLGNLQIRHTYLSEEN